MDARTLPTARRALLDDRLVIGLLILTAVSGTVDAVSFLGLGHVFTANMTGNVVFLAFAAAGAPGISIGHSITALATFLAGAVVGGYFCRRVPSSQRSRWFRRSAVFEAALLFTAAIAVIALDRDATALQDRQYAVIVLTAVAMGFRNATVRQLAVPDLTTTTVVTMALSGLAADFALTGGLNPSIWRRVMLIVSLFAGAAIGALLLRFGLAVPLVVAAVGVLATTGYVETSAAKPT
jgi:uncharacterized membrane protein YoaK (UPF0700 family)